MSMTPSKPGDDSGNGVVYHSRKMELGIVRFRVGLLMRWE